MDEDRELLLLLDEEDSEEGEGRLEELEDRPLEDKEEEEAEDSRLPVSSLALRL